MNKSEELTYFRTNVIKKYVSEVMDRLEHEENLPKRLCQHCHSYHPLEDFYNYRGTYSLYCKRCLHQTSKRAKK